MILLYSSSCLNWLMEKQPVYAKPEHLLLLERAVHVCKRPSRAGPIVQAMKRIEAGRTGFKK